MSEDVARAVGAEGPTSITIKGKECHPRPLTIKELTELERVCLREWKKEYLRTFSDNVDLLPAGEGQKLLREKMEEVAKYDVSDLPPKHAFDPRALKINDKLIVWLKDHLDFDDEGMDGALRNRAVRIMTATALESDMMSEQDYQKMVGVKPKKVQVGYANWWITATFEGMLSMIGLCFRDQGVTKEEVFEAIGNNPTAMATLARDIEKLSAPKVGNG